VFVRVILCRRAPGPDLERSLDADTAPTLLFLHADAVARARAPLAARHVTALACATSWDRRGGGELAPGFRAGTLGGLFEALDEARELLVFGRHGAVRQSLPKGPRRWLIEIVDAPGGARERREVLEVALAAAAMELDARVLFRGFGYNHLLTDAARGWKQLTDFKLLDLFAEVPDAGGAAIMPPDGPAATCVDAAAAARLRVECDAILPL